MNQTSGSAQFSHKITSFYANNEIFCYFCAVKSLEHSCITSDFGDIRPRCRGLSVPAFRAFYMDSTEKLLASDPDGMTSYEFLVNNFDLHPEAVALAVDNIGRVDATGQFAASAARFLHATDPDRFVSEIDRLLKQAIDKDREKAYLPSLLSCIWGDDYTARVDELRECDDNFRRIYKRVHPASAI